ncbi:MAG: FISUMP domain-containing protein, partial [Candidatus Saccharibacteria bacterium]|nr:FISUMP domain-containing protein [Candidatus Saccharibacteria bacterium]
GYYKLQDMDSSICAAVDVDDNQLQVIDARDNKVYWIAKLKDGHCWMTQNLDLDLDSNVTYTHDNTDLGWGSDTATQSWTPDKSTIAWNGSTFPGLGHSYTLQYSADPGDWYYAGYDGTTLLPKTTTNYLTITPDANGDIINSSNNNIYFSNNPSRVNGGTHEHVGNYYNWSAAVASNNTSNYNTSTYSDITGNPQNSICPAGWRLPTVTSASPIFSSSGSADEFARLVYLYNDNDINMYSSAKLELAPLFFARGGNIYSGSLANSGFVGFYWSSTVSNSSDSYHFYFYDTYVNSKYNSGRGGGFSVRCVAR